MHSFVVDETGGLHGLRDSGRLESAIARPGQIVFAKELYPTVFDKAAVYAHAIIFDHPFVDGNKRTAMVAAFVFLENNGFIATAKAGKIEKYAIEIVLKKYDVQTVSSWLKEHCERIRK